MEPKDILAFWMTTHRALSPDQQQAFLARPEVALLSDLPPDAVKTSVASARRLTVIVQRAQSYADWFAGDPCEDDNLSFCVRCKPHPYPPTVVMTLGWSHAFHREESCVWLIRGQEQVDRRDGDPAPVERVAVQVALGAGNTPCLGCFPVAA